MLAALAMLVPVSRVGLKCLCNAKFNPAIIELYIIIFVDLLLQCLF